MKPQIKEYNCESGKTVEREMTAAETKAYDDAAAVKKKAAEAAADHYDVDTLVHVFAPRG